jgi:hypothetical protein
MRVTGVLVGLALAGVVGPAGAAESGPSTLSDKELCGPAGATTPASGSAPAPQLVQSMRATLSGVSAVRVRGVAMMEIPSLKSWVFDVRASRQTGLVYVAETREREKIRVIQVPGGKTYASGKYLFSSQPELAARIGDRWFEVPAALLTVKPGEADPDGPKGVFGMHIGHKAAIADFVQQALSWYPDQQAKWLLEPRPGSELEASAATIEKRHPFFGGCSSVLVKARSRRLHLSASRSPLPLQLDPAPGTISGHFLWGEYNQAVPKQSAPAGAVTLEAALGARSSSNR